MRLLAIRVGLIDPQHRLQLQAAADETPSVGKWFSANLNLSTALALATTGVTLVGAWYGLQSQQSRHDAQIAANSAAIKAVAERFDKTVVSREEYQNKMHDLDSRIAANERGQQQIYTVALGRAFAPPERYP